MVQISGGADVWSAAPFDASLSIELRQLIERLRPEQRLWLSGYLAGMASQSVAVVREPASQPLVTLLYGSQSGNSERVAQQVGAALAERGLSQRTIDMLDCRKAQLQEARILLVIVSTHGEGDPPDRAIALHELLHGRKAPALGHLQYSVLALGDSSYEKFCETGRQFDARLAELGAQRMRPRVDCDVDFEASARQWIADVVAVIATSHATEVSTVAVAAERTPNAVAHVHTRKNPFHAPVLANQRLTARNSTKDVRHIELSLEGCGMHHEPGDSIGVVARNAQSAVDGLLAALHYDAATEVAADAARTSLREALIEHYDIGLVTSAFVERYAKATGSQALTELLREENKPALHRYLCGRHLIDVVAEHPPASLPAADFTQLLRPLAPRLYSIASSRHATPREVHVTVGRVQYESLGRERQGLASGLLCDLGDEDATVPIYLHRNPNFRLPADPGAAMIMIGAGTGVAPFRGFIAEREASGARGSNWLFFGDRSFTTDFLYQSEWLDWRKRGLLRVDVAFSRDAESKFYVQHRMREHGRELYSWIAGGASVYVCGDAKSMAPDVHQALIDIMQQHGAQSAEQASEALLDLQRERRYQRDVY